MKKILTYLLVAVVLIIVVFNLPTATDGSQAFHDGYLPSAQERQMVADRLSR